MLEISYINYYTYILYFKQLLSLEAQNTYQNIFCKIPKRILHIAFCYITTEALPLITPFRFSSLRCDNNTHYRTTHSHHNNLYYSQRQISLNPQDFFLLCQVQASLHLQSLAVYKSRIRFVWRIFQEDLCVICRQLRCCDICLSEHNSNHLREVLPGCLLEPHLKYLSHCLYCKQ